MFGGGLLTGEISSLPLRKLIFGRVLFGGGSMLKFAKNYRIPYHIDDLLFAKHFCISQFQGVTTSPVQSRSKFSKFVKCQPPRQIGLSNARPLGFPGTLYCNKVDFFAPLSRSQSLSYPMNIYKFLGRTYNYQ